MWGGGEGVAHVGQCCLHSEQFIAEQVTTLRPVLDPVKKLDKIFIPPVPRFAFGGCCENITHSPNTRTPTHSSFALTEHVRQCNCITKHINDTKTENFKVIDILSALTPSQHHIADKASALKKITHRDNVHLTESGYKLLAGKIVEVAEELKDRQPKHQHQSMVDPLSGREIILWGGFYITVGCRKKSVLKAPVKKGFRSHPYRS